MMENTRFIRMGFSWKAALLTTRPPSWACFRPSLSGVPVNLASSFPGWASVTPWPPSGAPYCRKRLFFKWQNRLPAFPPGIASTCLASTKVNSMIPA